VKLGGGAPQPPVPLDDGTVTPAMGQNRFRSALGRGKRYFREEIFQWDIGYSIHALG
jgi:hypothetical protein